MCVGLQLKPTKNDFLHKTIIVTGSDGYSYLIVDEELNAYLSNGSILIAYSINGKALAKEWLVFLRSTSGTHCVASCRTTSH